MRDTTTGIRFSLAERDALFALARLKRLPFTACIRQVLLTELALYDLLPNQSVRLLVDPATNNELTRDGAVA